MIKCRKGNIKVAGSQSEVLTDLATIVRGLIEHGKINEEMIDVAVGLGKAKAQGNADKFMKDTLKEALQKVTNATEIKVDLSELIKQIKEEKEENEG